MPKKSFRVLDPSLLQTKLHQLQNRTRLRFFKNVLSVRTHGVRANVQHPSDFSSLELIDQESKNFHFPFGKYTFMRGPFYVGPYIQIGWFPFQSYNGQYHLVALFKVCNVRKYDKGP